MFKTKLTITVALAAAIVYMLVTGWPGLLNR
jgi:hypothetical protein